MIDALVSGRLAGDPKLGISHNGTEYAMALLWVPVGLSHLSVSAVAFDPAVVDELLTLSAGDAVAVVGEFNPGYWQPFMDRPARFIADMEVRGLVTAYQVQRYRNEVATPRVDPVSDGAQFPPTKEGERP